MKNYNNNEESSYIQYLDANNLYGWSMSKKLPVNGFRWLDSDEINEINEEFIKNYNEKVKVIFLKWMLDIRRDYMIYTVIYRSYQKEWKSVSVKNSFVIYLIRKNMSCT